MKLKNGVEIKIFLVLLLVGTIYVIFKYYPQLEVVASYGAKKACSCSYIAGRTLESIKNEDLKKTPLNLAEIELDKKSRSAQASVFGLFTKKAEYRKGIGCVLIHGEDDYHIKYPGIISQTSIPGNYPYGDVFPQKRVVMGVDYPKLQEAVESAFDPEKKMSEKMTRAVLVLYKDTLIAESYAQGYDENTPLLGWSMTKSIINAWVGMMVKDGKIALTDDHLLPQWTDQRSKITLNDMMHMTSGLEWEEVYDRISPATDMLFRSEDIVKSASRYPLEFTPGTTWEYSSGTTNLISGFLRTKYSKYADYLRYPRERIFDALNMKSAIMETDEAGNYIGSSYCYATPRDWGRFGSLYLHDGMWKGKRLLPEGWVKYSATPAPDSDGKYGAHFWLGANGAYSDRLPKDLFCANGYEGQRVFIIPSKNLVIVRMGLKSGDFTKMLVDICDAVK